MNKDELRKRMIQIRKDFSNKENASQIIAKKVMALPEWQHAKTVCIYESLPTEVDTQILRNQKKVFVWEDADVYIVPGVAFDRQGNRLGRGKGFYDRLLARVTAPKIGLAFSVQVIDKVPVTSYDVQMSLVVTEI